MKATLSIFLLSAFAVMAQPYGGGSGPYPTPVPANAVSNLYSTLNNTSFHNSVWAWRTNTCFTEYWSNTTAWTVNGNAVSNGMLYANNGGSSVGSHHTWILQPNDASRIYTTFYIPSPTNLTGVAFAMIGVDPNNVGQVPGSGVTTGPMFTFGIDSGRAGNGNSNVACMFANAGETMDTNFLMPGTYTGELFVDTNQISFTLMFPGHTNEVIFQIARNQLNQGHTPLGAATNLLVYLSDARNYQGLGVGPVGARFGYTTIYPPSGGIEKLGEWVDWTASDDAKNIRLWMPQAYDSRWPVPLIVFIHGTGWDENFPWAGTPNNVSQRKYFQGLVTNGFALLSAQFGGNTWGTNAMNSISNAVNWTKNRYAIGQTFLMSESMGGIPAAQIVKRKIFPIAAWASLYSVFSISSVTNYSNLQADLSNSFIPGLAWSQFAAATSNWDPTNQPGTYYNVPMRLYASPSDVTVPWDANSQMMTNIAGTSGAECILVPCTGPHGDASHYKYNDVLSFFRRYSTYVPSQDW